MAKKQTNTTAIEEAKDLLLICGFVAGYFNFKSEQKEMYNGGWKSVALV